MFFALGYDVVDLEEDWINSPGVSRLENIILKCKARGSRPRLRVYALQNKLLLQYNFFCRRIWYSLKMSKDALITKSVGAFCHESMTHWTIGSKQIPQSTSLLSIQRFCISGLPLNLHVQARVELARVLWVVGIPDQAWSDLSPTMSWNVAWSSGLSWNVIFVNC